MYEVCSKGSRDLSINNIFLYLELTEYYPLQNSPLHSNASLPPSFPLLDALFEGCLWYRLQVIRCISDVFHCLKSSSFNGILSYNRTRRYTSMLLQIGQRWAQVLLNIVAYRSPHVGRQRIL
jgi:hypothetical protein